MKALKDHVELNAILEVKEVAFLVDQGLYRVSLKCYGGSLFDLILYTNGGEPCPYQVGDFYQTDGGQHGGWSLNRIPDFDRDEQTSSPYLSPTMMEKITANETWRRASLRRRPKQDEPRCEVHTPSSWTTSGVQYQCSYVSGHSGEHHSGIGAGAGYFWSTED